ncbi:MAG: nucleotidyl transferase AbiEii/AbiGii toxin family protein [Pseudomonadota bacterium]
MLFPFWFSLIDFDSQTSLFWVHLSNTKWHLKRSLTRFLFKGALTLRIWRSPEIRPTMDIDMLGKTNNEVSNIVTQIRDILTVDVEADGLVFDSKSIRIEMRVTVDGIEQPDRPIPLVDHHQEHRAEVKMPVAGG